MECVDFVPRPSLIHSTKKPVTTMLTYPWKCTVLHCNHPGNTWKPLVLMTRHFDYCLSASEADNQSVRSSAPVVSRCFPGGCNVKLYISRGRLAWWLLAFLCCVLLFLLSSMFLFPEKMVGLCALFVYWIMVHYMHYFNLDISDFHDSGWRPCDRVLWL